MQRREPFVQNFLARPDPEIRSAHPQDPNTATAAMANFEKLWHANTKIEFTDVPTVELERDGARTAVVQFWPKGLFDLAKGLDVPEDGVVRDDLTEVPWEPLQTWNVQSVITQEASAIKALQEIIQAAPEVTFDNVKDHILNLLTV